MNMITLGELRRGMTNKQRKVLISYLEPYISSEDVGRGKDTFRRLVAERILSDLKAAPLERSPIRVGDVIHGFWEWWADDDGSLTYFEEDSEFVGEVVQVLDNGRISAHVDKRFHPILLSRPMYRVIGRI